MGGGALLRCMPSHIVAARTSEARAGGVSTRLWPSLRRRRWAAHGSDLCCRAASRFARLRRGGQALALAEHAGVGGARLQLVLGGARLRLCSCTASRLVLRRVCGWAAWRPGNTRGWRRAAPTYAIARRRGSALLPAYGPDLCSWSAQPRLTLLHSIAARTAAARLRLVNPSWVGRCRRSSVVDEVVGHDQTTTTTTTTTTHDPRPTTTTNDPLPTTHDPRPTTHDPRPRPRPRQRARPQLRPRPRAARRQQC